MKGNGIIEAKNMELGVKSDQMELFLKETTNTEKSKALAC